MVKGEIFGSANSFKGALSLGMGPSSIVLMYEGYEINAYTFYMRKQDAKSANQNSGVQIEAYDSENHAQTYYGFIEEI